MMEENKNMINKQDFKNKYINKDGKVSWIKIQEHFHSLENNSDKKEFMIEVVEFMESIGVFKLK